MTPRLPIRIRSRPSIPSRLALGLVALLGSLVLVSGCSVLAPGFDPTGACTSDGKAPGAYPQLEALLPPTLDGTKPQMLDSGRNCSADGLATLASHGITEVRFAGALWPTAAESGTSLAVFSAPGLTAAWLGEYYEAGARTDSKVVSLKTSTPTVDGRPGFRLDAQNDTSLEAIVTWPDATGSVIRAAIVSEAARDGATPAKVDAAVERAIAAFGP